MKGVLYLIPNTLGESEIKYVIPDHVISIIHSLDHFIVENLRTARRFLLKVGYPGRIDDIQFYILNKHTIKEDIPGFIDPCKDGVDVGILSEAGVPVIADPGTVIVEYAHNSGIKVVPLTGPSSILLAIMASGLNGQNFSFLGYLPVKRAELAKRIKEIESRSLKDNQTQVFIEAPYRNMQLFEELIKACKSTTYLAIAVNLTTSAEKITLKSIEKWRQFIPDLNKKPAVFLLLARPLLTETKSTS